MYRHPQTKEEEYPRTVVELLHHSLAQLVEQFPERVIDRRRSDGGHIFSMPAYEWPGAGSERGGSAEHMKYEQVVFLPERNGRVFVVSVGDKQFDSMHTVFILGDHDGGSEDLFEYDVRTGALPSYYSVLFRYSVSPRFADALLGHYHEHIQGKEERNYAFASAFEDVLQDGTRYYIGCPLFAVDPGEKSTRSGRAYANISGSITSFCRSSVVEVPEFWRDRLHGDLARRVELSRTLAHYLQGESVDPSFRTGALDEAFQGWSHTGMGRVFSSNAYDLGSEEKALLSLQKSVA